MAYLLVVDDDADSREVLSRYLNRAGYECAGAPNGREALASILTRTPDLVVLDLLMPEMDGTDLVEILRSYLRLQSLPIVVLTAAPESPQAYRAKRQKIKSILSKGKATFEEIHAVIREELRLG